MGKEVLLHGGQGEAVVAVYRIQHSVVSEVYVLVIVLAV